MISVQRFASGSLESFSMTSAQRVSDKARMETAADPQNGSNRRRESLAGNRLTIRLASFRLLPWYGIGDKISATPAVYTA